MGITAPCVKLQFPGQGCAQPTWRPRYARRSSLPVPVAPGPVLIDIPKDVSKTPCEYEQIKSISLRSYNPVVKGHSGQIRKAVAMLLSAKRPYIYTGGGIILANAARELNQFVDLLGYPVTNTLMGLGGVSRASDRKFLGMLGMHGTYEANMAMQNCDVLIAIGRALLTIAVIGNPEHFASVPRKIIHIDIDPSRSPSASRSTFPSSATSRKCSRS